jgi:hypothetical protein
VTTAPTHLSPISSEAADAHTPIGPILEFIRAASGGRVLNMHLQMAVAPLVLDQYTSLLRSARTRRSMPARLSQHQPRDDARTGLSNNRQQLIGASAQPVSPNATSSRANSNGFA